MKEVQKKDKTPLKYFTKRFNWPELHGKTLTLKVETENEFDIADVTRVSGYDDKGNRYLLVLDRLWSIPCTVCGNRFREGIAGVCLSCVNKNWEDVEKVPSIEGAGL
jgi:hypothetical protein